MAARKKNSVKHKTDEILIPDKLYFRIGEVATLCHLPAYVLRFWESEFPQLKPVKSSTGQRMYRKRDVENVLRIKQLLYDQGFTISGEGCAKFWICCRAGAQDSPQAVCSAFVTQSNLRRGSFQSRTKSNQQMRG